MDMELCSFSKYKHLHTYTLVPHLNGVPGKWGNWESNSSPFITKIWKRIIKVFFCLVLIIIIIFLKFCCLRLDWKIYIPVRVMDEMPSSWKLPLNSLEFHLSFLFWELFHVCFLLMRTIKAIIWCWTFARTTKHISSRKSVILFVCLEFFFFWIHFLCSSVFVSLMIC